MPAVALVRVMVRPRAIRLEATVTPIVRRERADDPSDAALVDRVCGGDRSAEEQLFRRHVDYIAALSLRLLGDRTEADDVVQETFLDALSQLRSVNAPSSLRAWLAGIAVHKTHRRFRRRKLRALLGLYQASHGGGLEGCAHERTSPELRTELGLVDAALSNVADADRAAWMLRYVEGYVLEEVAELCGCSLATAKRRIKRAQEIVRAHVELDEVEDA